MKYICLNLKRFEVPRELGGVNSLAPVREWGAQVVAQTQEGLCAHQDKARFIQYLPEAHLLPALGALDSDAPLALGCQGLHWQDIAPGGNFGAFTSLRPAAAMRALGVQSAIIGHCEERRAKADLLKAAGVTDFAAVNTVLNQELRCAAKAGMSMLYCIGEQAEERGRWREVLRAQLQEGLRDVPREGLMIAYEPVWAIGPGKTPPDRETIQETARFIKAETGGLPLLYGGGLKADNAAMLASIPEVDGGLIALTRFAGEIGFYPDEYLHIIDIYLGGNA